MQTQLVCFQTALGMVNLHKENITRFIHSLKYVRSYQNVEGGVSVCLP